MTPLNPGYHDSAELREMGFAEVGEDVQIGRDCTVVGFGNIRLGNHIRIDGPTALIAASGSLTIGDHIHIGGGCHLSCAGGITLGDFSGLSQGVKLYSATDDYTGGALTNPTVPAEFTQVHRAPLSLGRHVIVGAGSVVLPGANIAEGAAVGALSLVMRPLEPWGLYVGQPARLIHERRRDLLALEARMIERTRP